MQVEMTGWGLMKSIGVDKAATEANYFLVNTFENIEQAFSAKSKMGYKLS